MGIIAKSIGMACVFVAVGMLSIAAQAKKPPSIGEILDRYVLEDSKGWMFNRYDAGSMTNVKYKTQGKDMQIVRGYYTYNGGNSGWVEVEVVGGEVQCFRYWDFPDRCRAVGTRSPAFQMLGEMAANAAKSGGNSSGGMGVFGDPKEYENGICVAWCNVH